MFEIINADCLDYIADSDLFWDTIFADPPDNIGIKYGSYTDNVPRDDYIKTMRQWIVAFIECAETVWLSYNAKWTFEVGAIVKNLLDAQPFLNAKACVQTFTFGQHNQKDLGNNHRPLIRLQWNYAKLYPEAIRIPSWRQENGDKRADPRGRIPGSVFDFPRVTGNSKQRRKFHPTQLHEGLVERCLKLTTPPGGSVLDPFGGTGTTLRVCRRLGFDCTLVEIDPFYCEKIREEHEEYIASAPGIGEPK